METFHYWVGKVRSIRYPAGIGYLFVMSLVTGVEGPDLDV